MATFLIIIACILFVLALILTVPRILLAPISAYLGLLAISFATNPEGYPLLPINSTILFAWVCMTIVVTVATLLQPAPLRFSRKGVGYMLGGAIAGMAVGLLGFTFITSLSLLYGVMIVATAAGIFFGFMLYTNTPEGRPVALNSGNFFRYLFAKGFPVAITVMQIGVVAVILIAIYRPA